MAWFSGPKQLPTNRFGYTPPLGATANGWACSSNDCGAGGDQAPRRWPATCPRCGSPADPMVPEPWKSEAEQCRFQWLIENEGDDFGYFREGLFASRFGQVLQRRDLAGARAIAGEAQQWATTFNATDPYKPMDPRGLLFFYLVHDDVDVPGADAFAAELLGAQAAELDYENADYSRIEDSDQSHERGQWLGFVNRCLILLSRPGGRSYPQSPAIDRAARYVGGEIQRAMTVDDKERWRALIQTPELS
jgi:hypothetical protein